MASRRLLTTLLTLRPQTLATKITTTAQPRYCTYKSSISLDKLYPNSDVNAFSTNPPPPSNDPTKFSGFIPMEKLTISYSKSSGPGGMNVNKLNTKATVTFNVTEATWIPDLIRKTFTEKFKNQITREGTIHIQSDRTRFQHLNTADALQKLREMIRSCEPVEQVISIEGIEKARKLREKAARERLLTKRRRSNIKSSRGSV